MFHFWSAPKVIEREPPEGLTTVEVQVAGKKVGVSMIFGLMLDDTLLRSNPDRYDSCSYVSGELRIP